MRSNPGRLHGSVEGFGQDRIGNLVAYKLRHAAAGMLLGHCVLLLCRRSRLIIVDVARVVKGCCP